jgi:hypothetical protein
MDFLTSMQYKVDTVPLKSKKRIWNQYGKPYFDTVQTTIYPVLDSLYKTIKSNSSLAINTKQLILRMKKPHHKPFQK